jgi:hypothetical protein
MSNVTGEILSMLCEDEKWHPCAFLSKRLNDKEMLRIIQALETWSHYLEEAKHEVQIWMDHQNLWYLMSCKEAKLPSSTLGIILSML